MSENETVNQIDNSVDGTGSIQELESIQSGLSTDDEMMAAVEKELAKLNKPDEMEEVAEEEEKEPEVEVKKAEEKKQDEKLAARFAALSRREKEISLRENQSKDDLETVNTFKRGILEGKENPKGVMDLLESHGITFEDLARAKMGDENLTKDLNSRKLELRLEAVERQRLADIKEAQDRSNQAQLDGFKSNIASFIEKNGEKYQIVANGGLVDDVFKIIEKDAKDNINNKSYQLMSIETAVSNLESALTEYYQKLNKLPKFSKVIEKVEDIEPEARDIKASKTLSNSKTASPRTVVKKKGETDADREAEAIKLLEAAWRE
jgi:hypothetical protein